MKIWPIASDLCHLARDGLKWHEMNEFFCFNCRLLADKSFLFPLIRYLSAYFDRLSADKSIIFDTYPLKIVHYLNKSSKITTDCMLPQ